MNSSFSSKKYRLMFVMKACPENLRNVIFRNQDLTPAKSKNIKLAIGKFLNWAMDIADGLNYIHERGLVHRHLKLENILVSNYSKEQRMIQFNVGPLSLRPAFN